MMNDFVHFSAGDKIYIEWGQTVYDGVIIEVTKDGIWLTEDDETEEFISYLDLKEVDCIRWEEMK